MKYFLDEPVAAFRSTLELPEGDPLLFAFHRGNLIVGREDGLIPSRKQAESAGLSLERVAPLGLLAGRGCVVATVPIADDVPAALEARSLRRLFGALDMDSIGVAAVA